MTRADEANIGALVKAEKWDKAYRECALLKEMGQATPGILYLGCFALFGLGHIHQAEEWVRDYAAAGGDEAKRMYLAAFIQLHARRPDQALLLWTRIVQLDPSQTFADGLIERAREDEDRLLRDAVRPAHIFRFVPFLPEEGARRSSSGPGLLSRSLRFFRNLLPGRGSDGGMSGVGLRRRALLMVGLGALILGLGWGISRVWGTLARTMDPFYGLEETLPEPPSSGTVVPAQKFKDAKFIYKSKEDVVREYRAAREHIAAGKVNQGRMMLSKIDLSNASFEIKERSGLLRDAVPTVDRRHFNDALSPAQVIKEADLCSGVQVLWRGLVTDPRPGQGAVRFLLKTEPPAERKLRVSCADCPQLKEGDEVDVMGFVKEIQKEAVILDAIEVRKLN